MDSFLCFAAIVAGPPLLVVAAMFWWPACPSHARSRRVASPETTLLWFQHKVQCPYCRRLHIPSGIAQHVRAAHGLTVSVNVVLREGTDG